MNIVVWRLEASPVGCHRGHFVVGIRRRKCPELLGSVSLTVQPLCGEKLTTFMVMGCACSVNFLFTSSTGNVLFALGDLVVSFGQFSEPGNRP